MIEKQHIIIGSIIAAVVGIIVLLFVLFYEAPLKSGKITLIQKTTDTITRDQHKESKYRYVTKWHNVTHYRTDAKGKRTSYQERESYEDRVFDHYEYYIEEHFNGADIIITIEAPSTKHQGKIRSANIYITTDRIERGNIEVGSTFYYDKNLGDKKHDPNNKVKEIARQRDFEFNLATASW